MPDTIVDNSKSAVTLAAGTIHNPNEQRHYMRIKPFKGVVKIWLGERLLAESSSALRVLEVGKDLYDPVFYIPADDLAIGLYDIDGKSTHCPLKGDASYFGIPELELGDNEYFAWSYESTFDFASEIAGYYAFNPDFIRIEEFGTKA